MTSLPLLLLFALLGAAVWHDVRARRIPNAIVFPGMLAAFALHALVPAGYGLFGAQAGGLGLLQSVGGWGLGLALLLPALCYAVIATFGIYASRHQVAVAVDRA